MAVNDHFARLGLPRRFALTADELRQRYLAKSRDAHPDLVGESADSMEQSSKLNEAYAVLNDPLRRAEHMLELMGGPSAAQMKQSPPEFLEEMLELRMAIEEAKADPAAISKMDQELSARREVMVAGVAALLDSAQPDLSEIRRRLNALRFVNGLIRDLHEG